MNKRHCLKVADRINALLVRQLNQGIDRQRMLQEPRYARDVLFVCDACTGTDLPALAVLFRQAMAQADSAAVVSGGASRFLGSMFGSFDGGPNVRSGRNSGWFGRREGADK